MQTFVIYIVFIAGIVLSGSILTLIPFFIYKKRPGIYSFVFKYSLVGVAVGFLLFFAFGIVFDLYVADELGTVFVLIPPITLIIGLIIGSIVASKRVLSSRALQNGS